MSTRIMLSIFAAVLFLQVAAAAGPVAEWLEKNKDTTMAGDYLAQMYPKPMPSDAKLTFFVPTNQAIQAFEKSMGMDSTQMRSRKELVDMMLAYHIIPGYTAKELKMAKSPAVAATGDINYMLRLTNTDKGIDIEDVQGNVVSVTRKPMIFGNIAVIVIDKVLMSGSYFFTGQEALKYYPQWSKADALAMTLGFPEGTGREMDLSFFVPDNKAIDAASGALAKLSKDDQKNLLMYHMSAPARIVPTDFKTGTIPTKFTGHDITVDASSMMLMGGNKVPYLDMAQPKLVLTSETGNKATTNVYNVHVGKSVWQGIDAVLVPKFGGGVTTEAGAKKEPAMGKTEAAMAKKADSGSNTKNRKLAGLGSGSEPSFAGRSLMGRGGGGFGGSSSIDQGYMYASTVSQANTARAIEAAATGKIPSNYATRYGSYSAKQAALYGDCINCYAF